MVAIAYDTFYPHLRKEDLPAWRDLLGRLLAAHLLTAREHHWNCTAIANVNALCNGGGGLAALALLKENPDAPESLYLARKLIRQYVDYCYGADGGCTEGAQYWEYGGTAFLRFACAMETAIGTDDGLLSLPQVTRGINNVRAGLCNDGKLSGINDTIPMPMGSEIAWFLAGRFNDPFALWYADKALDVMDGMTSRGKAVAYGPSAIFALLFRPDVPRMDRQPPLPPAIVLRDIQVSMIRSGTNYDCTWTAGLKGSRPPYTHHNQPDTGAYFIDLRGERLLIDPGYYKDKPTDHSLPIIGGDAPAQPRSTTGLITDCEALGDLRLLVCDSTAAYRGAARRVARHLVMVGEEGLILLDDIVAADNGAKVLAQYQAGGPTGDSGAGRRITVQGDKARLRLEVLTRPGLSLRLQPERSLHDIRWGYHFAECRFFPVTGEYAVDEMDPLVTVFTDEAARRPGPSQLTRQANELTVTMPSGRKVVFAYFDGRWRLDRQKSETR